MSKRQVIMVIGLLLMVSPFLGFPSGWDKFFSLIGGFLTIVVAYRMSPGVPVVSKNMPYVESRRTEPESTSSEITNDSSSSNA